MQNAPLGGQNLGAGVDGGVVGSVNAGAVAPAQRRGLVALDVSVCRDRDAVGAQGGVDDAVEDGQVGVLVGVAQLAGCLSTNVVDLPGGSGLCDGVDDVSGMVVDAFLSRGGLAPRCCVSRDAGDEPVELSLAAECFDRLGAPGLALVRQRTWLVFGLAGF
jgi:hypothetical protein